MKAKPMKAKPMKIAIGSTNPVKIKAVKKVLKSIYPQASFVSIQVDSKVKHQPLSIKETKLGAQHRASAALKSAQADIAVGLEGGVFEIDQQMYHFAWAAIIDKSGKTSFGGGMCFILPNSIAQQIRQGEELGPLMDKLTGVKDVKKKGGAISVLTDNLTTRTEGYISLVKMALAKFRRPDLYG